MAAWAIVKSLFWHGGSFVPMRQQGAGGSLTRQAFRLALGILVLCLTAVAASTQQNSVALLIGNAVYPDAETPLQGPVTDARALAVQLKRQGFDVAIGENLKKEAMRRSLDQLYAKIKPGSIVLVYFGGFGIQSDRQTYLIPTDAQIWNEADVRRDGFSLDKILAEMTSKGARAKIAVVDASRRNPFERRFRSVSAGLAAVTVPRGAVVITSAPPDTVIGDNGSQVFMTSLVKELAVPGATIEQAFNRTRIDVSRATQQQQVPWFSSSLEEDFQLGSQLPPSANILSKAEENKPLIPLTESSPKAEQRPASNAQPKNAEAEQSKAAETKPAAPSAPSPAASGGDASVALLARPPNQLAKATIDPGMVGTFERESAIDDYAWHFIYSISPDGTCRLTTTQEEDGVYHGGKGEYRTVGEKTGRVRTGTYRAAGSSAIEVTSATGVTAIFRSTERTGPVNQANPVMLGSWRANVAQGGTTWTLTIQNNPNGTYHYKASTEDNGSCAFADRQWRTTSAVTGKSDAGTYRFIGDRQVEIVGLSGSTIWQRQ